MHDYGSREMVAVGRCSGQCCKVITLQVHPMRIKVLAANYRVDSRGAPVWARDPVFVEENFEKIGESYYDGIYPDQKAWWEHGGPAPQYRCKAFTGTSCSKYDERPDFCRRFGTPEQPCRVPDCTLSWHPLALDRWADDGGQT